MADRFTSALSSPEMTVVYAIIPLCTVQPFLYLRFTVHSSRFTENPKRKEVKSGKGFHAKGIRRVPFQLGEWFDRFDRLTALRSSKGRLTTPRKIEGPNLGGVRCCNGHGRVE